MRANMIKSTLDKAYRRRATGDHVIIRSDRVVQYASTLVRELLASKNAVESMTRKGNCIEIGYNRKRAHSALGHVSPAKFE